MIYPVRPLAVTAAFALCLVLAIASCGGGGGAPAPTTGSISGDITIGGPFNGAVELKVGLFNPGTIEPFESATAGRVTSTASCSLTGRTISYDFSDVEFGNYNVGLYSEGVGSNTIYYMSEQIALSEDNANVDNADGEAAFTGPGPWGTISGFAVFSASPSFPAGLVVFVGFSPLSDPPNVQQWAVAESDLEGDKIYFNVDYIAYGDWLVGLYGYDPVTHQVTTYGAFDSPVSVTAGDPYRTNVIFAADFAGDPGSDPVLAEITGEVTFSAALPEGQFIYVAANTVPPQQGAPPATFEVKPEDVGGDLKLAYALEGLADGDYSVSIFSYNMATHQAVYFGDYPSTVTISGGASQSGIDFNADVSVID